MIIREGFGGVLGVLEGFKMGLKGFWRGFRSFEGIERILEEC